MKLTEKDAIWCKTQKQWDSIIEMLNIPNLKPEQFKHYGVESVIRFDGAVGHYLDRQYYKENKFSIHKAKDILKKSFKKDVLKRLEKIEKVISDNTSVNFYQTQNYSTEPLKFDLPTKELEEKIDKWFLIVDSENREILEDHFNEKLRIGECVISDNYAVFHSVIVVPKYYTEITFDQFKKWVLKEEEKPLSIREVQVKVSSQEEANECAEIAKACGEELLAIYYNPESDYMYFRKHRDIDLFGIYTENNNYKEISLQEFRERFGKKQETEIDWSKWGQIVTNKDIVVYTLGKSEQSREGNFYGVCIYKDIYSLSEDKESQISHNWIQSNFTLCTEPITLKNE